MGFWDEIEKVAAPWHAIAEDSFGEKDYLTAIGYKGPGAAKKPEAEAAAPMAEAPTPEDPSVKENLEKERTALRASRGRAATLLTGGKGLLDAPKTSRRVLLGA